MSAPETREVASCARCGHPATGWAITTTTQGRETVTRHATDGTCPPTEGPRK